MDLIDYLRKEYVTSDPINTEPLTLEATEAFVPYTISPAPFDQPRRLTYFRILHDSMKYGKLSREEIAKIELGVISNITEQLIQEIQSALPVKWSIIENTIQQHQSGDVYGLLRSIRLILRE